MLWSTLNATLSGNLLICKGTVSPGEGRFRVDEGNADEQVWIFNAA